MSAPVTLAQFHHGLQFHDWDYAYSDDPGVFHRGFDRQGQLERTAKQSAEHGALFNAWRDYKAGRTNLQPVVPSEARRAA